VRSADIDQLRFRPDIEGLRAIAILLVVAAHAGVPWLAGGFVGVDVFFVLSGFLITSKLVQEVTDTGRIQLLPFYLRRLRRLLPALLVMLLVVGLVSSWLLSPTALAEQFFAAQTAALWLSNVHFALDNLGYFASGSESNLYLHTWSLGVEEQFYLAWPALVIWLVARDAVRGITRLKIGMLVVALTSLLGCIVLTKSAPLLAFYMMPMRAWQFATGALLWLVFARGSQRISCTPRLGSALSMLGLLLIVTSALLLDANHPYPGAWAVLPTLGTALVIFAGSSPAGRQWVYGLLTVSPLQWLGRISYSWYLWHWPVLLLGYALTGSHTTPYRVLLVIISLGLATISHRFVEAPLRRWPKWLQHQRLAALASLACMAAIGLLGAHWANQANESSQSPQIRRYVVARADAPAIYSMGCDEWYHSANVRICAFGANHATHTAVLIGDSHVGQWFPAAQKALDKPGWRLLVLTKSSCPMVDAPIFYARIGREYTECAAWRAAAVKAVAALKPDLLLFGSSQYEFSKEQWIGGTTRLLKDLSPAVGHIHILRDTPALPFDGPDCLLAHATRPAWLDWLPNCTAPAENSHAAQVFSWLSDAAAGFPNVSMLDMNQHVCPGGTCSAELDGRIVFRDSQHLAGSFAASLAPALADKLGNNREAPHP
jgi:peptidoglycan/LPS O-acetylase OafA/YrhL